MASSRKTSSSPDSILSEDSYLYESQQQQHLTMSNPQLKPRSSSTETSTSRSNTPLEKQRTPTPQLVDLSAFAVTQSRILDELERMAETLGTVDELVDGAQRAMTVAEMVNLLIDAERSLGKGDVSQSGEKASRGLEMAVELDDQENIERAKRLLDLVGVAGQRKINNGGMDGNEDEEDSRTERGEGVEGEREVPFSDDEERVTSPIAGMAEVLGDVLADEFDEESDWGFGYDGGNESNKAESDSGGQIQNESHGDVNDSDNGDANNQDDQEYENDFDPRNRPQTPVPPRSFDDDDDVEEVDRPETAGNDLTQSYDPWQAYADFKQKELYSSSEANSNDLDEVYCDCNCRNCCKCHYNTHTSYSLSSEGTSESEAEEQHEDTITATIIRKRRRRDPIASANMNYTYIHTPSSKARAVASSKFSQKRTMSRYPKPWYRTDENADLDDDFCALFWHPHTKTVVLQESVPDWDMRWLEDQSVTRNHPVSQEKVLQDESLAVDKASLQAGAQCPKEPKNYVPWRTEFWFHFGMPMRDMASRVRKTNIFPEQTWEFIPNKEDWDRFEETVPEGERFSMQFLEWERERIQNLVREKSGKVELGKREMLGRPQNGLYKQEQGHWVVVQVNGSEAAMDWAWWAFVVVVALVLLFCWIGL